MLTDERRITAKNLGVCLNCLTDRHARSDCVSSGRCQASKGGGICGRRHHTMLHPKAASRSSSEERIVRPLPDLEIVKSMTASELQERYPNVEFDFEALAKEFGEDVRPLPERQPRVCVRAPSKLSLLTKVHRLPYYPHGEGCKRVAPVVMCDLMVNEQAIQVTLLLCPQVSASQLLFDVVSTTNYVTNFRHGVAYGNFEVVTRTELSFRHWFAIVDTLPVVPPPLPNGARLRQILQSGCRPPTIMSHPWPWQYGEVHGVIGYDILKWAQNGASFPLQHFPDIQAQESKFGQILTGCLCNDLPI